MTLDLDTFLTTVYVAVDDVYKEHLQPLLPARRGPAPRLSDSEVLTLALLASWGRWSSDRAFWRWAQTHLPAHFPRLGSLSRFHRRRQTLAPLLGLLFRTLAQQTAPPSPYRVLDATPVPVVKLPRWERSPFRGEAALSWCAAKREWYVGFKLFLAVTPEGVITSAALLPANVGDRPGAESIFVQEQHPCYLADKGFCSQAWEQEWRERFGVTVLAAPYRRHKRAWPTKVYRRMSRRRQIVEVVINLLKDGFGLERHRAKTVAGLTAQVTAKLAAYVLGVALNARLHRRLLAFASLIAW